MMVVFISDFVYGLTFTLTTFLVSLVLFYKWSFSYWKKCGLEDLSPVIPFGNIAKLFTFKLSFAEQFAEFYKQFKIKGVKHGGVYMFTRAFYIPVDAQIIKDIIQKDFSHFTDRGFYINEEADPLSGHLFAMEGSKWKNLRAKLSGIFTSGKLKMMFEAMVACAKHLDDVLDSHFDEPMDVKEVMARFTTDTIGSCAFGLEAHTLKNVDSKFRHYGKRIVENTAWENLKNLISFMFPQYILTLVKFKITKPDVEDYMMDLVKKTVQYRETNNVYRKDFIHLLLQLKNRGKMFDDESVVHNNNKDDKEGTLTLNELAAQVVVFFVGGYETSSTTMTFALYELSQHQQLQEKLRDEVKAVLAKHNNNITYDAIMQMTYMDQVINETLRKYPPVGFLNRKCTKAYTVPNTKLHIEEGTMVLISTLGLHYDPEYYPDPNKFDPDRFNEINKSNRPSCTWMPFGDGPRICIGLRFGLLQVKVGLTALLRNYKVTLNSKTKLPIVMEKKTLTTTSDSPILLNVKKLD